MPFSQGNSTRSGEQPVLISEFTIKIGAEPESDMEALMRDMIKIEVDDSLHLPDMFTLHLHDKALKWVDSPLLAVGKGVEISAKAAEGQNEDAPSKNLLIKGEITALEPDFNRLGEPTLLVRGYDRSHRLHRGKQTRSFIQMTDSEIVEKVAKEGNLKTEVAPTSPVYEYVFQNNQTNLEFLLERARRIGYQLYVEDQTLHFCPAEKSQGQGPELEWERNLLSFQPRLSTAYQANEIIVRGWDPFAKREIIGRASKGKLKPEIGLQETGGELAQQAFHSPAQTVVVNYPVTSPEEAQAMAQALCNWISGAFIQAEGVCLGDSRLQAGKQVKITGVGERFGGNYFITQATHIYKAETGYETHFTISGRQPDTLSDLLKVRNGYQQGGGVVIGLVTNNRDPKGLGRVKVKFPWLADHEESAWARLAAPMAGSGGGFFYVPEVNDEVLIAFEHGDIHYPYVLGALWNGKDKPPEQQNKAVGGDGKVNQRLLKSRSGHRILLDDTSGKEKIEIVDSSGNNKLTITSADAKITIQTGGGAQTIVLDNQSQAIELKGGGRSIALRNGQVQIT